MFPIGHFALKDKLDEGISFAHAVVSFLEGSSYQQGWFEIVPTIPGSGQIRVVDDTPTAPCLATMERIMGLLDDYEPLLPADLRERVVISMRDREWKKPGEPVKVDFVVHCGVRKRVHGMDLGKLVATLGVMFGAAPSPHDVFRGEVDGNGLIQTGITAVRALHETDVHAMRRSGIRRVWIGDLPFNSQKLLDRLRACAQADLGPGIEPLVIIIVRHLRELLDRIRDGPDCVLPIRLAGGPDRAIIMTETTMGGGDQRESLSVDGGLEDEPVIGKDDTVVEEEQHQEEEEEAEGKEEEKEGDEGMAGTTRWMSGTQVVKTVGSLFKNGVRSFWRRGGEGEEGQV